MAAVMHDDATIPTGMMGIEGRCNAHLTNGSGDLCKNPAGKGTDHLGYGTCYWHGGRTRNHRTHAREEAAEALVLRLGSSTGVPVHNPATELSRLAGEVVAWKNATAQLVADLEQPLIATFAGGIDVHPLVKLHERSLTAASRMLAEMAKLGIEERRIEIDQATQQALYVTLTAVLTDAGYDPGRVLPELGSRLRALDTGGTER